MKGKDMAYRRKTYRRAAPKKKRKTYSRNRKRSTARSSRVTVVLQMQPMGGMPQAGLTLGKKNYRPVRAQF